MDYSWICINSDSDVIQSSKTSYNLFDARPRGSDAVLDFTEQQLVSQIQCNHEMLELLLHECGFIHYSRCLANVPRYYLDTNRKNGDLDMVIAGPNFPPELAVLEFKRVKIRAIDSERDKSNKLNGIAELFNQLQDRVKLGFSITYGALIVHGDLGNRNTANTMLRHYARETNELLWDKLISESGNIPTEAGLVLVRLDYPTTEMRRKNFCVRLQKRAHVQPQSPRLTDMYIDFMNSGRVGNYE